VNPARTTRAARHRRRLARARRGVEPTRKNAASACRGNFKTRDKIRTFCNRGIALRARRGNRNRAPARRILHRCRSHPTDMHRQKYFTEFAWREAGAAPESIKNGESAPSDSRRARSPEREIFLSRRVHRNNFASKFLFPRAFAARNCRTAPKTDSGARNGARVRVRVSFSGFR
jgi:hypothetical protein